MRIDSVHWKARSKIQSLSTSLILITSPISPKLYHSKIVKSMLIDEFMDKVIKLRLSSLDLVDKNSVFVLVIKVTTDPDSAQ